MRLLLKSLFALFLFLGLPTIFAGPALSARRAIRQAITAGNATEFETMVRQHHAMAGKVYLIGFFQNALSSPNKTLQVAALRLLTNEFKDLLSESEFLGYRQRMEGVERTEIQGAQEEAITAARTGSLGFKDFLKQAFQERALGKVIAGIVAWYDEQKLHSGDLVDLLTEAMEADLGATAEVLELLRDNDILLETGINEFLGGIGINPIISALQGLGLALSEEPEKVRLKDLKDEIAIKWQKFHPGLKGHFNWR